MGILQNAPLLSGIGNAVGGIAGSVIQNRGQRKLANDAQAYELDMWNRSNEYNSPEAQMARLKQAGLNPNLVYGSGNVSGQSSSPAPKAHVPNYQSPVSGELITGVLASMLSTMKAQADTLKTKAETDRVKQQFEWFDENWVNKSTILSNEALMKEAQGQNLWRMYKTGKLWDYSTSKQQVDIDRLKNLYGIEQNKFEISKYDADLAKSLYTFKETNPWVTMILNILKTAGMGK